MRRIVLASASPRRRELLGLLKLKFDILPAKGEEILTTSDPGEAVRELSRQKAEETAARLAGEALVIGADTVVALDGEILGKPRDEEEAFSMIRRLSGRTHSVFTGVTFIMTGSEAKSVTFAEETRVTVSALSDWQIWDYVNQGESLDKAGAYAIQGTFGVFVERIEGDYNNVVGLPVSRLYRELMAAGIDLLEQDRAGAV